MKKILLALVALLFTHGAVVAQCTPDQNNQEAISPKPLPLGPGLPCAYVGQPYSTQIDVYLPDSVEFSGTSVALDRIKIDSVKGHPTFISITPNNSNWEWDALERGCVSMVSTANPTTADVFPITIYAKVYVNLFGNLVAQDTVFQGYDLRVLNSTAEICPADTFTSIKTIVASSIKGVKIAPNPVTDIAEVTFNSNESGDFNFGVYDATGREVMADKWAIMPGSNRFTFSSSQLPAGIYYYSISNGKSRSYDRFVIAR